MGNQNTTKHRRIYDHLHTGIMSGQYGVGQQIPTEMELARDFDASRVTVARAIRDLVKEGLVVRRRGSGSFVKKQVSGQGTLFGWLTAEYPSGIMSRLGDDVAQQAHAKGFGLLLGRWPSEETMRPEMALRHAQELCKEYISRKVAGVFFIPIPQLISTDINLRIAQIFQDAGIPIVLVDRDLCNYPDRSGYDLVSVNNVHCGFLLTQHLISLGRRRIVFIMGDKPIWTLAARAVGYQAALREHGITLEPQWITREQLNDEDSIRSWIDPERTDAYVCGNDGMAASLMRHLSSMGVRVPQDIAIVGMDDDVWATRLTVSLTTIRQPTEHLGEAAIQLMIDRLAHPDQPPRATLLEGELVVRESCGGALRTEAAAGTG